MTQLKSENRLNGKEIAKGKTLKVHVHPYSNYRKYDNQHDSKHNNDFLKQEAMFSSQFGLSTVFNPESERNEEKPSKSPSSEIFSQKDSKNLKSQQNEWKSQDVKRHDKNSTLALKDDPIIASTIEDSKHNSKVELE